MSRTETEYERQCLHPIIVRVLVKCLLNDVDGFRRHCLINTELRQLGDLSITVYES